MPTTKCKLEFNKVLQSLCTAKYKKNLINLHIHLVGTMVLILLSKVVSKKLFCLKLFILKNTLHALNPLIPRGNKRPHILKSTYSF